jgi:SAM-dependent methyltransferase
MSTDQEWVRWGQQDPYFAVITNPKFRKANLTEDARREFFESGRYHVQYVLDAAGRWLGRDFLPQRALDFGCGVGRVALSLARTVPSVVGVDVSPDMLAEMARNASSEGLPNVQGVLSDLDLSAVQGDFDLVHSCITFQHIGPSQGRLLLSSLVGKLRPGGLGAIQITYGKAYHAETFGQPPQQTPANAGVIDLRASRTPPSRDPEMQMNAYNLSEVAFILQAAGVTSFKADFTDHGGELGVFLFFEKPLR